MRLDRSARPSKAGVRAAADESGARFSGNVWQVEYWFSHFTWQSATRKTAGITLRQGQLNYLAEPLVWADLTP